jgi:(2Fe-2S) ferredoxin
MVVYPDDTWYSPKTKNDIEKIITDHVRANQPVKELLIKFKKT